MRKTVRSLEKHQRNKPSVMNAANAGQRFFEATTEYKKKVVQCLSWKMVFYFHSL